MNYLNKWIHLLIYEVRLLQMAGVNIVSGCTTHLGIQWLVSFVYEFGLIRYQARINNDMPACQVLMSSHCTLCAQIEYCHCTLCWETSSSGHSTSSFWFLNLGMGYMGSFHLREMVLYEGTHIYLPQPLGRSNFVLGSVLYVYFGFCVMMIFTISYSSQSMHVLLILYFQKMYCYWYCVTWKRGIK